jgi:hypothetical protein
MTWCASYNLNEKRGFDFSGYHPPMLERRILQRLTATAVSSGSSLY